MNPFPQLLLAACAALLCDCLQAVAEVEQSVPTVSRRGTALYLDNGTQRLLSEAGGYRSFRLNHSAGCLVLSSLDDSLLPLSWVLGPDLDPAAALFLPGQVPSYMSPGFTAFTGLAESEAQQQVQLSVVNAEGRLIYSSGTAALLEPAAGLLPTGEFCILGWESVDDFSGMLSSPRLQVLAAADGSVLQDWELALPLPAVDAELLYMGEDNGLLLVLYDIYYWQILRLDRTSQSFETIYTLEGQPMYDRLLPSHADGLSHALLEDGLLEMDVITFTEGELRLMIDPQTGIVKQKADPGTYPRHINQRMLTEDKYVKHFHMSQQIFPLKIDGDWSLPAYFDKTGRLLLLNANGPVWLDIP